MSEGVWFVYGTDWSPYVYRGSHVMPGSWSYAYPINVFDDEVEAGRAAEQWERVVFWPFGTPWDEVRDG